MAAVAAGRTDLVAFARTPLDLRRSGPEAAPVRIGLIVPELERHGRAGNRRRSCPHAQAALQLPRQPDADGAGVARRAAAMNAQAAAASTSGRRRRRRRPLRLPRRRHGPGRDEHRQVERERRAPRPSADSPSRPSPAPAPWSKRSAPSVPGASARHALPGRWPNRSWRISRARASRGRLGRPGGARQRRVGCIPGDRVLGAARGLDLTGVDALVISACVHAVLDLVQVAEEMFGLPVISAATAAAYVLVNRLGLSPSSRCRVAQGRRCRCRRVGCRARPLAPDPGGLR